jgi:hypothetical protein
LNSIGQPIQGCFRPKNGLQHDRVKAALEDALRQLAIEELEEIQAEGYQRKPVTPGEFDIWESEQAWG